MYSFRSSTLLSISILLRRTPSASWGQKDKNHVPPHPHWGSLSDPGVLFTHCPAHTPLWPSPAPIPSSLSPALPCFFFCLPLTHTAFRKPSLIHPNPFGFFHSLPTLSHSDSQSSSHGPSTGSCSRVPVPKYMFHFPTGSL